MKWEELNTKDFEVAVKKCQGVCIVPLGIIEKHGPHSPLGTDLLNIRKIATLAAEREPAIVFPAYYFTQIYEGQHCAGTIATKPKLLIELLENVCDEISRNNLQKIILLNGHGGNISLLQFFLQTMLYRRKDYIVYLCNNSWSNPEMRKVNEKILEETEIFHAGEWETSLTLANCPHLVKMDYVPKEPSISLNRLKHLSQQHLLTSIDWYASYPDHYGGDARLATKEKGEKILEYLVGYVTKVIKTVKEDKVAKELYDEFISRINEKRGEERISERIKLKPEGR